MDELQPLLKEHGRIEQSHGLPAYRWTQSFAGPEKPDTLVGEHEFDSWDAYEALWIETMSDPEWQRINEKSDKLVECGHHEIWTVVEFG